MSTPIVVTHHIPRILIDEKAVSVVLFLLGVVGRDSNFLREIRLHEARYHKMQKLHEGVVRGGVNS